MPVIRRWMPCLCRIVRSYDGAAGSGQECIVNPTCPRHAR
jgi:hypothetical protein